MVAVLAQETSGPPPAPEFRITDILIPGLLVYLIFYFMVSRPQKRDEKARREKIAALARGDKVRTRGGVIGTVTKVTDDEVILRTGGDAKVQITFAKAYVEDVLSDGSQSP